MNAHSVLATGFRAALATLLGFSLTTHRAATQPLQGDHRLTRSAVTFALSDNGIIGMNVREGRAGTQLDGNTYLFGGGIWFGAEKRIGTELRKLTVMSYNPNSGSSWMAPGLFGTSSDDIGEATIFDRQEYDPATGAHRSGLGESWPLWASPGQTATIAVPGAFVADPAERTPSTGLRPSFVTMADDQVVMRYRDDVLDRYETGPDVARAYGYPIGIEVDQSVYGWEEGSLLKSTLVVTWRIVNRSGDTLHNCVLAPVLDPDVGTSPERNQARLLTGLDDGRVIAVSDTTPADSAGGAGSVLIGLLEYPMTDGEGYVDNDRRLEWRLQGEIRTFPAWGIQNDPGTGSERYAMMVSGIGNEVSSRHDVRVLLSGGTFSMMPGDTAHAAIALVILPGTYPSEIEREGRRVVTILEAESLYDEIARQYHLSTISGVMARSDASLLDLD